VKVAIYARVSTNEQSVDKQIEELTQYCQNNKYEIVAIYKDVISGVKDSRPELDKMMKAAFRHEFDAIVAWKLDRLGRSIKHLISIVEQMEKYNIGLIFTTQGFDTTKPEGKLLFHIFGAIAQFERELISERTKMGLRGNTRVGKRGKDKKPRKKGGYYLRWMKPENAAKYK